jgi:hypothetical protein
VRQSEHAVADASYECWEGGRITRTLETAQAGSPKSIARYRLDGLQEIAT